MTVTDLAGKSSTLPAGKELVADPEPGLHRGLPADLVELAQGERRQAVSLGRRLRQRQVVTCRLGAANIEDGLKQVNP